MGRDNGIEQAKGRHPSRAKLRSITSIDPEAYTVPFIAPRVSGVEDTGDTIPGQGFVLQELYEEDALEEGYVQVSLLITGRLDPTMAMQLWSSFEGGLVRVIVDEFRIYSWFGNGDGVDDAS